MKLVGFALFGIALLSQPASTTKKIQPVTRPPMKYFAERCERCHGVLGENFGGTFAEKRSPKELIDVVRMMANGPGGEPLSGSSFDALVALHRAIKRHQPFLVWTQQNGKVLKGEATPGSTITATAKGKPLAIKFTGSEWELKPGAAAPAQVTIKAKVGSAMTTLNLGSAAFSHSK